MKKNIIIIIVVAVIIALLGAGIAVVLSLPGDIQSESKTQSDILIYDKTSSDAEQIMISNETGEFSFMGFSYAAEASLASAEKEASESEAAESAEESSEASINLRTEAGFTPNDIKVHYTMQSLPDIQLDKSMMNVLAYQCCYLTALQVVDKSGEKYAEYGLDSPRSTVTIVFSDGSIEKIMLGNNAPNDQGIYMRRENSPNVYLAIEGTVNMMLKAAYDFIDTTITQEMYVDSESAEGTTITSLTISGSAYDKPISVDDQGLFIYNTKYIMRSPREEIAESAYINAFGSSLYGMEAESVVAAEPTTEDIEKYGLKDPYMDITISASDESTLHLLISKAGDDGYLYIMHEGGNLIYRLTTDGVKKWYDLAYTELLSPYIIMPNPVVMAGLEVTNGGSSYKFDVVNTTVKNDLMQDVTTTDVTYDGKEINTAHFNDYIELLTKLVRTDPCDLSTEGLTPEFTAKMSFESGEEKADSELCVYKSSDGRFFAALNGQTEAYVNTDYFQALLRQAGKLAADEDLEAIEDLYKSSSDSESSENSGSSEASKGNESSQSSDTSESPEKSEN